MKKESSALSFAELLSLYSVFYFSKT